MAELALGLAGFAGVAAAFGGRDRSYEPAERVRLGALFGIAAIPLGGSLLTISLMSAGLTAQSSYLCVSSVGLLALIAVATLFLPRTFQLAAHADASTELWAAVFATVFVAANFVLLAANLILGGEAWPLISAFSSQLVYSLWMFFRILTRRN